MKGYAKLKLSDNQISRLQLIQAKAEKFQREFKAKDYQNTVDKRFLFFEYKKGCFDSGKAKESAPIGCYINNWFEETFIELVHPCSGAIKKILAIAMTGEENDKYYDDELCQVINKYAGDP